MSVRQCSYIKISMTPFNDYMHQVWFIVTSFLLKCRHQAHAWSKYVARHVTKSNTHLNVHTKSRQPNNNLIHLFIDYHSVKHICTFRPLQTQSKYFTQNLCEMGLNVMTFLIIKHQRSWDVGGLGAESPPGMESPVLCLSLVSVDMFSVKLMHCVNTVRPWEWNSHTVLSSWCVHLWVGDAPTCCV